MHRLVKRHGDGAVLAFDLFSARPAHDHVAVPTPVQQDDRLLSTIKRRLRLFDQPTTEDMVSTGVAELRSHVHQFDGR